MKQCAVCGEFGASDHHLLAKSVYPEYREDPMNLIPLCGAHHLTGDEICAHGALRRHRAEFNRWLRDNDPKRFAWLVEHSRTGVLMPKEIGEDVDL